MTLFRLIVWRHLLHEPLRTILTVLGVGLGVAVYVAVATANIEVLRTFEEGVLAIAGRTTLQVTSAAALPGGFDETVIETIRQADGVALAAPVLEFSAIWRGGASAPVTLPVLGVDLLAESRVRDYTIASAVSTRESVENPATGEADWERYLEPDAIFIGRAFAKRYGVVTGVPIDLQVGPRVRRLTVRGVIEGKGPASAVLEELAVMDIAAAQLMFDRLGQLDRIDVITDSGQAVDEIAGRIRERLPSGLLIKRPEQRNVQIERMTRAFRLNVASLSAVALLVGLFLVYNTMSFAVLRRRREIGILRSLGMLPYGIGRLFLLEGLLLGIVGWGVGILGGMVLARVAIGMMATTSGDLYDIAVQHSQGQIPLPVVAQSLLIGITVALLGSIGPIREASAVQPVRALAPRGYEVDAIKPVLPIFLKSTALFIVAGAAALAEPVRGLPIFGYLSAFLLIVATAMLSPVVIRAMGPCVRAILPKGYRGVVRIAADELERASVRNAVAVSALMVGLALMIGMGILIQSFRQTVDVWLDQTVKADVIVAPPTWLGSGPAGLLPESVGRRLEGIPGVDAVDSYRDLRMEFRDRPIALVARRYAHPRPAQPISVPRRRFISDFNARRRQ